MKPAGHGIWCAGPPQWSKPPACASSNFGQGNLRKLQTTFRFSKIYLCPEPGYESVPADPAHIGVVLEHRLERGSAAMPIWA
jgi:hypothetical protein